MDDLEELEDDLIGEPEPPRAISPMGLACEETMAEKEEMQRKHYLFLSQLQGMAKELPGKYQQRLPYDLLSSLANAVLDGTVFEIVNSLKEVQQLEERALSNQRQQLLNENRVRKQDLIKKQRDLIQQAQFKPHTLPYIQQQCQQDIEVHEAKFEEDLKKKDMKIILELDQKVMDQQSTLEKAGVPGFLVTNNPYEMRLQMYLLDFITRLSQVEVPDP